MSRRGCNVRWTPEMDEFLVKKRTEGMTFHRIAFILGISRNGARLRFSKLRPNSPYIYVPHNRVHSYATREAVVKMRLKGAKLKEISKALDLRVNQVHGIWNHWKGYEAVRRNVT